MEMEKKETEFERGKREAFNITKNVLQDWIDRIRKQNDIDWNDGTYVLKQHRKSMKAFPVPESMLEKFEIDLEVLTEAGNKEEKIKYCPECECKAKDCPCPSWHRHKVKEEE